MTRKSMEIVDLEVMEIGINEVIRRQVRLDKKMSAYLEKHDISNLYGSFVRLETTMIKGMSPRGRHYNKMVVRNSGGLVYWRRERPVS